MSGSHEQASLAEFGDSSQKGYFEGNDPGEDRPYRDEETLRELYLEKEMTIEEIAEKLDADMATIHLWLEKFDIERRSRGRSGWDSPRMKPYARFQTTPGGYEEWVDNYENERDVLRVHRLLAVLKFGFDAVKQEMIVHHKNNIAWDNRIENLELMTRAEHSKHHQTARVRRKRDYVNIDKE